MSNQHRYWFAATPFGYGWWRPSHRLGWISVLSAIALAMLAGHLFPPETAALPFWGTTAAIAAGFLLLCWLERGAAGQTPRVMAVQATPMIGLSLAPA